MISPTRLASWAMAALLVSASAASAQMSEPSVPHPPADAGKHKQCFFVSQLGNWHAPNNRTILFRVNLNEIIRLDMAGACPELLYPDSHLITRFHGDDTVCSALDWDISVAPDIHVPATPCIVKKMTALTPAQIAAIPKKDLP